MIRVQEYAETAQSVVDSVGGVNSSNRSVLPGERGRTMTAQDISEVPDCTPDIPV